VSGSRARALRKADPAYQELLRLRRERPPLYTHPISGGPNRKERRGILKDYRAYRVRATRARNVACARLGIGTPAENISEALKRSGSKYLDGDRDGATLLP
jgi:hypothetical protein